jgi:type II secretory pathway pseudopilin PulG
MSRSSTDRLPRRLRSWLRRRLAGEGGFILLESVIAISLITVIMSAVGAEYVSGLASADHQRAETTAIQLADSAVDGLRALDPTDLLTGRDQSSVTTERATLTAIATVSPWVSTDAGKLAYDPTVNSGGASATVPTAPTTQQPGTIRYQVYEYLECAAVSSDHLCRSTTSQINYIRAIVAVVWTQRGCEADTCAYTTSTLISADADPEFDDNQPLPAAPQCQLPTAAQTTVEVGDSVSVQMNVKNNTGVPPFFWSEPNTEPSGDVALSSLGLALSPAGLISGAVTARAASGKTLVIVTDSFGSRTDQCEIPWSVYPKLTFQPVPDQSNLTTDSVDNTAVARVASGGDPGYTFSDPNSTLPTGLSIASDGTITGTPQAGTYNVQLKVTDAANHSAMSNTFSWTVTYPPIRVNNVPVDQKGTVGVAVPSLPALTASGGNGGPYTWTVTGLPPGVTFNSSQKFVGTPTTTGTYTVTIAVRDAAGDTVSPPPSFTWSVYAAPTIGSLAAVSATEGQTVDKTVSYTCPNMTCTLTLSGTVPGIGLATTGKTGDNTTTTLSVNGNGTVEVTGQIQNSAVTGSDQSATYQPVVTIANPAGASAQTPQVNWTIYAPPAGTGLPNNVVTAEGASPSDAFSYSCANAPCTVTLSGTVPGLGLSTDVVHTAGNSNNVTANNTTSVTVNNSSGTLYINGLVNSKAGTNAGAAYTPTVTITDSGSASVSYSRTYTVYVKPTIGSPGILTMNRGDTVNQPVILTCSSHPCAISASGVPSGVSLNKSTINNDGVNKSVDLVGTVSSSAARRDYVVTVTIDNGSQQSSSVGVWTVN